MDGCIYRTKDGECDLYANGGKYLAFCVLDMENCDGRKMSNADRIRAMSDDELANIWWTYVDCGECPKHRECNMLSQDCLHLALEWLKQEAKE